MNITTIDLYAYFGIEKPQGAKGELTCYVQQTTWELHTCRTRPAVLILPGGGYEFVSEREEEPVALPFLNAGYQVFVLNYSVKPLMFPIALREACLAMRYIRENARTFDVNVNMVAAIGFSAGGHLCGTLGTMYDCSEVVDIGDAALLRPDALGLCYPVTVSYGETHEGSFLNLCGGDSALRQRLSLDRLVRKDMPPVFLWHIRDDFCVPVSGSIALTMELEKQKVDYAAHFYRRGGHGMSVCGPQVFTPWIEAWQSKDVPGWLDSMLLFFQEIGFAILDEPKKDTK